ncbi:hypothetical protein BSR28_03285 [Boudabousia liubingyangii]|uniref:DNA polymerase IV n=1 Tax=Boudabousia liubingyangii TaxID=1921764 RepID=UPI0009402994|nr:DNA polymerase IV [Boudabousia liubingyangii]OKL47535.1 hypothetical protein BSR28_03285 [Boudabousia liubingyangii]
MSRAPRVAAARKNWGSDDTGCDFLHIDMDSFFAAVEIREQPQLAGKPLIVGGSKERGVVSACNYEARKFGVHSAMPIAQARRLCPQANYLPVRHELYSQVSKEVMKICASITPQFEQVSIDEAFLNIAGARLRLGSATQIGQELRARIRNEVGLPASVGIASVKYLSKIASAHAKPDGLLMIPKAANQEFLNLLPIEAIWGVGPATAQKLASKGITRVEQAAALSTHTLVSMLGQAAGIHLYELCHGIDNRGINTQRERKSLGKEITFSQNQDDMEYLHRVLLNLADELTARLRSQGWLARTVALKVRTGNFETKTKSQSVNPPLNTSPEVMQVVAQLAKQVNLGADPIRLIGIRLEGLIPATQGIQTTVDEDPKAKQLAAGWDAVRARFGRQALGSASLLGLANPKEDPDQSLA